VKFELPKEKIFKRKHDNNMEYVQFEKLIYKDNKSKSIFFSLFI